MTTPLIITIDGPAGVGKSTIARNIAAIRKLPFLDTGAMFRCLALKLGEGAADLPEGTLHNTCAQYHFTLTGAGTASQLACNGVLVGDEIRTEAVGLMAARVASLPVVRAQLKVAQQALGQTTSLVAEGRDMGTEIFPKASYKFFLDASAEVRAQRRLKQLQALGGELPSLAELTEQILQRDAMDRNRAIAPLRPADDALTIDTSTMDIAAVQQQILSCLPPLPGESA